jgi:hypothetical protein
MRLTIVLYKNKLACWEDAFHSGAGLSLLVTMYSIEVLQGIRRCLYSKDCLIILLLKGFETTRRYSRGIFTRMQSAEVEEKVKMLM